MNLLTLETEYLRHLAASEKNRKETVKTYRAALHDTWRFMEEMRLELDTEAIDSTVVDLLVAWWSEDRKLSARTVHKKVGALRSLFRYARQRRLTRNNPFVDILLPEKGAVDRVTLTDAEFQLLTTACEQIRGPKGPMVKALWARQNATAVRVDELVKIDHRDVDLNAGVLRVRHGKGSKYREIPLGPAVTTAVREWLVARRQWLETRADDRRILGSEPEALWLADRGRRLSKNGVYRILDELSHYAGLPVQVRIHDLRAMTAQRWRRAGMDNGTIQLLLGHGDPRTTKLYVKDAFPDVRSWSHFCDLPGAGAPASAAETPALPAAPTPPSPAIVPAPAAAAAPSTPGSTDLLAELVQRLHAAQQAQSAQQLAALVQSLGAGATGLQNPALLPLATLLLGQAGTTAPVPPQ